MSYAPDLPQNQAIAKHARLVILGASALMLLWMARALVPGSLPLNGDLLTFYYPVHAFYARALAAGQRFDWMPSLMGGVDLVGEGQLGGYHPLHWLLYRVVPVDTAFLVEVVVGYPLTFAGAWLFLRRWCASTPALFGAMLFAFCGFTFEHGVHPNMLGVFAHLPWLFWAIDRLFVADLWRPRLRASGIIALLTGSQLLLGHPQAVWICALAEGTFAIFMMATLRRTKPPGDTTSVPSVPILSSVFCLPSRVSYLLTPVSCLLTSALLGIGIGAIQLLATSHAVAISTRAGFGPDFPFEFALPPLQLLQLLHPYLFWGRVLRWNEAPLAGDEFAVYAGCVPLALIVWWLWQSRDLRRTGRWTAIDHLGVWALVLGGIGLLLATGRSGGLYYLQTWLPFVGMFRAAVRYVAFADIAVAVASAAALTHLIAVRKDDRGPLRALLAPWILATASGVTGAILVVNSGGRGAPGSESFLAIALGPMLFIAAAVLLTLAVLQTKGALVALVLLAAGDQALYGLGGISAWHDFAPRAQALESLGAPGSLPPQGPGRIVCCQYPNLYTVAGYRLIDGYFGITPQRLLNYRLAETLRLADVHYAHASFVNRTHVAVAEQISEQWYRLSTPVARARLLTRTRLSARPDLDVKTTDIDRVALVNHDLPLPPGVPGDAAIFRDDPGHIEVVTKASTTQLLTVSETVDEGWQATVDGNPVRVEHVNGDFLGCVVPAGAHLVTFEFRPAYRSTGGRISLASGFIAFVLLIGGAGGSWRRGKTHGASRAHGDNE